MSDQATPTQEEALRAQVEFLNKVWTDEAFRARLESDPKAVLKEMGGRVPDDVQIKVVRDTDRVKYLHIPSPPPEGEISDADLEKAQGGTTGLCVLTITVVVSAITVATTP
jgi:hypothetical protein